MNLQEEYCVQYSKVTLHKIYEDFNVSHLGNTACMHVSVEWTTWVGKC